MSLGDFLAVDSMDEHTAGSNDEHSNVTTTSNTSSVSVASSPASALRARSFSTASLRSLFKKKYQPPSIDPIPLRPRPSSFIVGANRERKDSNGS